jgi:LuxR family transcriptional regulator, maltose regulon positive regulatory protein
VSLASSCSSTSSRRSSRRRDRHREALVELTAAGQVQARIVGEHALASRVAGWTIATHARLGDIEQARAALTALDDRLAAGDEIRTAAAVIHLAEGDPAGARRELKAVLGGSAPANPYLTLVEAHLLAALARRYLGDEHAARAAVERALDHAEPDRLILMTGAWELLTLPAREALHAALVTDILDTVRGRAREPAAAVPAEPLSPASCAC